jgi:hypothetical protein
MAFQTGTRVDPRLGALDFSGFTNAANIKAQAMANLGNQIGGAIQQYAVNKQKKNDRDMRYKTILPYTTNLFGAEDGENMAREFSKNPEFGAQVMQFAQMQNDQTALNRAIQSSTDIETGQIDFATVLPAYLELGGKDTASVLEFTQGAMQVPDPTAAMRNFDFLISQNVPQDQAIAQSFGSGGTTVNLPGDPIDDPVADAMRDASILPVLEMTESINDSAQKARAGLELLDQGTKTGTGETLKLEAKKFLNLLGVGEFDVSNQELFRNQVEPLMMEFVQKTKGAISNAEMNLFRSWSAGLPSTVEGNKKILKAILRAQKNHRGSLKIIQDARLEGITDPFVVNQRIQDYLDTRSVLYDNVDEAKDAAIQRGENNFTFNGKYYKIK